MSAQIIEALADYGCDTSTALERFLGKEDLYIKFIRKFLDDKNFDELKGFIETSDFENALKSVHTLKGVSGNLGFSPLYDITSDMVTKFRAQQADEAVAEYPQFEQIYTDIVGIINNNL